MCDFGLVQESAIMGLEYYCAKKYESAASKCEIHDRAMNLAEKIAVLRVNQIPPFVICALDV